MAVKQLSDGNVDGVCLGKSTTDLVGFYGLATPIAQPSMTATAVTAIVTTTFSEAKTGMWAFASSTVAQSFKTRVNQLIVDLAAVEAKLEALNLVAVS